jgi:hypothetical protein
MDQTNTLPPVLDTKCAWCANIVRAEQGCIVLCPACSRNLFTRQQETITYYGNVPASRMCWCGGKDGHHFYGPYGHGPEPGQ